MLSFFESYNSFRLIFQGRFKIPLIILAFFSTFFFPQKLTAAIETLDPVSMDWTKNISKLF